MKDRLWYILIILLLGSVLFFNVMNYLNEKPDLTVIEDAFKESQKITESLNREVKDMRLSVDESRKQIDSLHKVNEKTIRRFGYEISKMDEQFKNNSDTLFVNSVIRAWTERLNRLPGFFQTTTPDL